MGRKKTEIAKTSQNINSTKIASSEYVRNRREEKIEKTI